MEFRGIPVLFWFTGTLGAMMAAPALHAALEGDWRAGRMFLFCALAVMAGSAILGVAARSRSGAGSPRAELLTYAGVFVLGPIPAAAPIALLMPGMGPMAAYFEAASSLSTTGATLIARPAEAPEAVHLWRAMLGWTGGLATLVAALAVLAPRGLLDMPDGHAASGFGAAPAERVLKLDPGGVRAARALSRLAPLYALLTFVLTVALLGASNEGRGFHAFCHAMGIISTSGISPTGEGLAFHGSRLSEAVALVFMVAAASRLPWRRPQRGQSALGSVRMDPELRLMGLAVLVASAWLFGRHWLGVLQLSGAEDDLAAMARALWGTVATVTSFATTTGYVSMDWAGAQSWSGLSNPAMLLLGLAALGGGVASTAGGLKLFRAFALFQHAMLDLSHRAHPSAVDSPRRPGGRLGRDAVTNALVFAMLFIATMGVTLLALTATGLSFERSLVAAVAALSNAGPALPLLEGDPEAYAKLAGSAQAILCAAMILGRIEILAVIALMNPGWWRR